MRGLHKLVESDRLDSILTEQLEQDNFQYTRVNATYKNPFLAVIIREKANHNIISTNEYMEVNILPISIKTTISV